MFQLEIFVNIVFIIDYRVRSTLKWNKFNIHLNGDLFLEFALKHSHLKEGCAQPDIIT